jgi:hypothetical protein
MYEPSQERQLHLPGVVRDRLGKGQRPDRKSGDGVKEVFSGRGADRPGSGSALTREGAISGVVEQVRTSWKEPIHAIEGVSRVIAVM